MRIPLKVKNKIQYGINFWLSTNQNHFLLNELHNLEKLWVKLSKEENDYRGGEETYGYSNTKDTMEYISDRWMAAFRIKWIVDGLKSGKI